MGYRYKYIYGIYIWTIYKIYMEHIYSHIYIWNIYFFLVFSISPGEPVILRVPVANPTSCSPPGTHLDAYTSK